ncbi:unnamed protein product [Schistosoma turkestanicum]|nr:unnamed protein product [Schistosoma turkestanicum]
MPSIHGNIVKIHYSIFVVQYVFLCGITFTNAVPMLTKINQSHTGIKYPIILIPGMGGCQAFCGPKVMNNYFSPFNIWINFLHVLLPDKAFDYFRLQHDPRTYESFDSNECNVTFPGWGDTWSVEYLSQYLPFDYFGSLVSEMTKDKFYVRNYTIRAAPYDFRKSPGDNKEFVKKFKTLVEETYTNGLNRPVVLLGHSLGSLYTLYFLKHQTKHWKQKYIKSFMSVSAPLGGTVETLAALTSGDNFGVFIRTPTIYRDVLRTMTSLVSTLPNPKLWSKHEVLIITPTRNYTVLDYPEYFSDSNYLTGYQLFTRHLETFNPLEAPEHVPEIYCIYGSGLLSVERLIFKSSSFFVSSFPNQTPRVIYGNGDGTVNLRSLKVCAKWPTAKVVEFVASEHQPILSEKRFIRFVKRHMNR